MPDKKLVIFDFCGTLISFQTADRYVKFCVERLKDNKVVQWRHRLIRVMDVLRIFKIYNNICSANNWRKRMVLWQLKGVSFEQCDQFAKAYFEDELLPNVVAPVVEKLKEHLVQNDRVVILSGGYDIYIKYFAAHFGIREYVSSRITFENNRCLGKMDGKDCMRANKIEFLQPLLKGETTICYTDSVSDLPILELVDQAVVVSKQVPQQWAIKRNYQQIIWK